MKLCHGCPTWLHPSDQVCWCCGTAQVIGLPSPPAPLPAPVEVVFVDRPKLVMRRPIPDLAATVDQVLCSPTRVMRAPVERSKPSTRLGLAEAHVVDGGRRNWHNGTAACCSTCRGGGQAEAGRGRTHYFGR